MCKENNFLDIKRILISAGESSGDFLGQELLKAADAQVEWLGIGGPAMESMGSFSSLVPMASLNVSGFIPVIKRLPFFSKLLKRMSALLDKVDALVLIDYPGFNIRLAKKAQALGIPVYWIAPPQVWFWKSERLEHLRHPHMQLQVLFDFENDYLNSQGVQAHCWGHPRMHQIIAYLQQGEAQQLEVLDRVALFPGSRLHLVKRNIAFFRELSQKYFADKKTVVGVNRREIAQWLQKNYPDLEQFDMRKNPLAQFEHSICAPGTNSLEQALLSKQSLLALKLKPWERWYLQKRLGKETPLGLANHILSPRRILEITSANELPKMNENEGVQEELMRALAPQKEPNKSWGEQSWHSLKSFLEKAI